MSDELLISSPEDSLEDAPISSVETPVLKKQLSSKDFEVTAFETLRDATNYNDAINSLTKIYNESEFDNPEEGKALLSDYGNSIRQKLKEPGIDFGDALEILPIKPSEVEGETTLDKVNNWREKNLEFLNTTSDPDYIAVKDSLSDTVNRYASEVRRDEFGGRGSGLWAWSTDKFFRAAEGAVGSIAKLVGANEVDDYLRERTDRNRDEGLAGQIAYGLGAVVPLVGATAALGPGGGAAVLGAQAAGESRALYEESIKATGDEKKALAGASLIAASQALTLAPIGKAASGFIGSVLKQAGEKEATRIAENSINNALITALDSQKKTFGNVAAATLEAGVLGTAGSTIANLGRNIALDENGDITEGAIDSFLSNAILGGVFSGAHALVENAVIEQAKSLFKNPEKELTPKEVTKETNPKEGVAKPLFYKDSEGSYVPDETLPQTFEEKVAAAEEFSKSVKEYINEEPQVSEEVFSKEDGTPVSIPSYPDVEVDAKPDGTVLVGTDKWPGKNGRLMTYLFSKLGAKLETRRNILDGAFGAFFPSSGKIKILRSLGADPKHFIATLAHEGGHFIDGILNDAYKTGALQGINDKLKGFSQAVQKSIPEAVLFTEAKELSKTWRPGWDGTLSSNTLSSNPRERFNAYRSSPHEIYADVVSALLNDPEFVRKNYPSVYNGFEKAIAKNATLNSFWNTLLKMESDPNEAYNFNLNVAKEARQKGGAIEAAARENKIKDNRLGARLKRNLDASYQFVFNAIAPAKRAVAKLSGAKRVEGFNLLNDLSRRGHLYDYMERSIRGPLKKTWSKFLQLGVEPNTWAHYEWAKRVRDETTPTMERVKEDYPTYLKAGAELYKLLKNEKGVKGSILKESFFTPEGALPRNSEELIQFFAKLPLVGDTAEVLDVQNFINKYDVKDPDRNKKGMRDYQLASESLNKRKESIPIENLRKKVQSLPKSSGISETVKAAMEDILTPNAFAVRKFLVNAGGYTVYDATNDIAGVRASLGEEKFNKLESISKEYHDILSRIMPTVKDSQIFSPELLERMTLNSGNYVTSNVLKYFEGNDKISASLRSAIGSLNETGDELTATTLKMQAILSRAYRQRAFNAAVKIAELDNKVVEKTTGSPQVDVFSMRDKLSRSDPKHSYIISYNKGVPTLNKIAGGKSYERMFDRVSESEFPLLNAAVDLSEKLNSAFLTRQLKTIFNPAFVLSQKFYDRKLEAIVANSLEFTGGLPIHTSSKLRKIDKTTKEEIAHYNKTGELTGNLKKFIDLDGATLNLSHLIEKGLDPELSFEDAVLKSYGVKLPDENSTLEKIGLYSEKTLDKLGGSFFRKIAEADELRAKLNGFKIGKEYFGMSDAEAAVFGRERFGVPDPMGGGVGRPLINKMFLFGAAHYGGLRTLASIGRDMPKTAAMQLAYRVILPKMLVTTPIMYGVMKAFSGQEDADKYKLLNDLIPTNEKISREVILLGAQDGNGNYHNFFDINVKDITPDWKPWYLRLPQSRELTTVTQVFWPFIQGLYNGSAQEAVGGATKGGVTNAVSGIQPSLQYMYHLGQMILGDNPYDFYRKKGIFPDEVAKGGTALDKGMKYGQYLLSQQIPSAIPYNPFQTSESKSLPETIMHKVPLAGPMLRSLVGVSNYGAVESAKADKALKERVDAEIKLSAGDATKDVLALHRNSAGQISSLGKGWQEKVGPKIATINKLVNSWYSSVWLRSKPELEAARASGDGERYNYLLSQIERSSESLLSSLKQFEESGQD